MQIEVFKTDVTDMNRAAELLKVLHDELPGCRINFDLQDCDHILRVAAPADVAAEAKRILITEGHYCEELPD